MASHLLRLSSASAHSTWVKEDVLKARLKTIGVSEYTFEMEAAAGRDSGTIWRIIDVGGSRSQVDLTSSSPEDGWTHGRTRLAATCVVLRGPPFEPAHSSYSQQRGYHFLMMASFYLVVLYFPS